MDAIRFVPRAPLVDRKPHTLLGIIFIHDCGMFRNQIIHAKSVCKRGVPVLLIKSHRGPFLSVACTYSLMICMMQITYRSGLQLHQSAGLPLSSPFPSSDSPRGQHLPQSSVKGLPLDACKNVVY